MKKLLIAVSVLVALVGGVALGVLGANKIPVLANFSMATIDTSSEVIRSVELQQQVILNTLYIETIAASKKPMSEVLGIPILGTERKSFNLYSFKANLGFEGEEVEISKVGTNRYKIKFPEFIFLGIDGVPFDEAFEANGPLSWLSASIDSRDLDKKMLTEEKKTKYLDMQRDDLERQAQVFYTRIITSIDPKAEIDFEFAN